MTRPSFGTACTAAAGVAAALFVVLLAAPGLIHAILDIEPTASADVLARRAAFPLRRPRGAALAGPRCR